MTAKFELTEIPRRKNSNGTEGGPYLLPPGAEHISGKKKCETCGRMVKTDQRKPRKGSCRCFYYKRTTTFIDCIQDEFLLKQWGNRNCVWAMGQREDFRLHAASCKPDSDPEQTPEDKRELNEIAAEAQKFAGDKMKARIGTSLHKLTHQMDRGDELGFVPEPYPGDLKAYDAKMKELDVQWVWVEAFRAYDGWMSTDCEHKWGQCRCMGVAGTVDRIGWTKHQGRLRVWDIKTGSDYNKQGHAMQLAMYAHMVPYLFPGDTRGVDPDDVDLDVGYIIKLPAGKSVCEVEPMDLRKGWNACQVAKMVWDIRNDKDFVLARDPRAEITEMAVRAGSIPECKILWRNAEELGLLDKRLKTVLMRRAEELKATA